MLTRSRLQLGRADEGLRLSRRAFAEADFEEPWRYERVNGRLAVMAPSGDEHVDAVRSFLIKLIFYEAAHSDRVAKVVPEAWIAVEGGTDRIADLAVYLRSTSARRKIPAAVPELVFEITSQGYKNLRRDYEEKRDDYRRAGVREYVIVDRFDRRVTIFRRARTRIVEVVLTPEETYTTPLLPGLEIPLTGII